ncbi:MULTISPECIES: glycosyltransferase family 39 protein [unclassified Moorena]|uniref:glycosyltransferase family 39 protein n=2 Tax=unclassified Moorena TaxID=2683338 RepID=UPI0025F6BCC2|nr:MULTISPECIES: glycosyltransferase family 39 protein [unclassified Moorena]
MKLNTPALGIRANWLEKWMPIGLILLVATGLYLYQLGTESLWYDELFSINKTQSGISLPPKNLTRPFYFMILYIWMQFSTSTVWLRGLSVIFGLGSVFLIYLLGRRLAGKPVGLIAALLLTLSPLFINHAQEVRMYTLIPFLSLGGTLALAHALENPRFAAINWWAVGRFLALVTTPVSVTLFLPDLVLIGWQFRNQKRRLFAFGIRLLLIGSCWLPLVSAVNDSSTKFLKGWVTQYPKPNMILIVSEVTHLTVFWPLRHLLGSGISANDLMKQLNQQSIMDWLVEHVLTSNIVPLLYYMAYTAMAIGLLAIALLSRHPSTKLWWIKVWALLPAGSILLISYVSSSIWKARYLLIVSPYFLILLAAGLMQVWRWQRRVAVLVTLLYAIAVGSGLVHYYTTLYRVAGGPPT